MPKISVGLVEDNPTIAADIWEKLSLSEDIHMVLRAVNGKDLFKQLNSIPTPEVFLMDIEMPEMDGISTTRLLKQKYPAAKILILTMFDNEVKLFEAIKAGASGYLLKDEKPYKIINAITEILDGGAPMSPLMASKALNLLKHGSNDIHIKSVSKSAELTIRESEILEWIVSGLHVRQISEKLFVSDKTIRKHLEHIYQKLQVKSSGEAVAKVIGRTV
ncbi:response regulator transcription factor [Dyadobacter sp. CY107]|uniref:response regulator transcription factor n=1 Tax=Dyadobacter fanqingshengii TaxID=2906443 RepID=UPI001F3F9982|nr:response regulator transcription factor [Dyadobacter fanqingshengii]MCF2502704.1 response regulator transcription factor [Dyadobacter fanqingshengii]